MNPFDDLTRGLSPPAPPAELRRRALAAAGHELAAGPPPDLWARLWWNRRLRAAWVTVVTILLAGHVVLSIPTHRAGGRGQRPTRLAAQTDPELAAIVTLPAIDERALSRTAGPARGTRAPSPAAELRTERENRS